MSSNEGGMWFALMVIAMIAGCTHTITGDSADRNMKACIEAGYEWIDGDCVRART